MSNAIRCDRCLGYFDPQKVAGSFIELRDVTERSSISYNLSKFLSKEHYDFCPECTDLFKRFMGIKKGTKDEKNLWKEVDFVRGDRFSDAIQHICAGGDFDGDSRLAQWQTTPNQESAGGSDL